MDCHEASDPSTIRSVSAQAFSLTGLPLELQLRVLRECLTSKTPLLDHGAEPGGVHLTLVDERRGQDDICFAILGTCKLYHEEGLKLLYAHNLFSYTERFEPDKNWWSQPPDPDIPVELRPDYLICPRQHLPNLKHLMLRTMGMVEHLGSLPAIKSCQQVLDQCPHLQTLQLDIVCLPLESSKLRKPDLDRVNQLRSKFQDFLLRARRRREEFRGSHAVKGTLRQLVITGLVSNLCVLAAVKFGSRLLADGGKLGVGKGGKGSRFKGKVKKGHLSLKLLPEPSLIWLDSQDIKRWIEAFHDHTLEFARSVGIEPR